MKVYLLSSLFVSLLIVSCNTVSDKSLVDIVHKENPVLTKSVEKSKQEIIDFKQITSDAEFNSFISNNKKHSTAELVDFYASVNSKFKSNSALPALKHRILYSFVNDYRIAENVDNQQLFYYIKEINSLPVFDASLLIPIVKKLDYNSLDLKTKDLLNNILSDLEKKENNIRQDMILINDSSVVKSIKSEGDSHQSIAMQNYMKREFVKSVQKNCSASLELISNLRFLLRKRQI